MILLMWGHAMLSGLYPAIDVHLEHPDWEKWSLKWEKCWLCEQDGFEPATNRPQASTQLGNPLVCPCRIEENRKERILFPKCMTVEAFFLFSHIKKKKKKKKRHILVQTPKFSYSFRISGKKMVSELSAPIWKEIAADYFALKWWFINVS